MDIYIWSKILNLPMAKKKRQGSEFDALHLAELKMTENLFCKFKHSKFLNSTQKIE